MMMFRVTPDVYDDRSPLRLRARPWFAAAITAALLTLAACATPSGSTPTPTTSDSSSITPTVEATPTDAPSPTPSESATVVAPYNGNVLVVTADITGGRLEVTAMVPSVAESGGTCTLEIVDGGAKTSVDGTAGNGVTYCGLMSVPTDGKIGQVSFRVRYESSSTRAESALSAVEPGQ